MKKLIVLMICLVLATTVLAAPKQVSSYEPYAKNNGQAGKSHMSHLYLVEKDPSDWTIVSEGPWGKMTYDESKFVFNGHELTEGTSYTLVNYGGWPTVQCMGTAIADEDGDVHIKGDMPETLLIEGDNEGAKIWLVLDSDVNCDTSAITAWNPGSYLFEYSLI